MKTLTYVKTKTVKDSVKAAGRRTSADFVQALEDHVARLVDAATTVNLGKGKTVTGEHFVEVLSSVVGNKL